MTRHLNKVPFLSIRFLSSIYGSVAKHWQSKSTHQLRTVVTKIDMPQSCVILFDKYITQRSFHAPPWHSFRELGNDMTFGGHIVNLWPEYHHLRPSGAGVQMTLRGTRINYMPDKSHVINHYYQYTLFQNGSHFTILLFPCKLTLMASLSNVKFTGIFNLERAHKGQFAWKQENTKMAAILE